MMLQLEKRLGQSSAKPEEILPLVKDLVSELHDRSLPEGLAEKLNGIADHHGGSVPLHGRLFAQVLHYAAPLECPFPHKRGAIVAESFEECGQGCLVSDADHKELQKHADMVGGEFAPFPDMSHDAWLAEWTQEEELLVPAENLKQASWFLAIWGKFLVGAILLTPGIWAVARQFNLKQQLPGTLSSKSHMV